MTPRPQTDLLRVHHGADADGEGAGRHLRDVVVEEARVGLDGVLVERLDPGAGDEGGARLVERHVPVRTDTCAMGGGWGDDGDDRSRNLKKFRKHIAGILLYS